MHSPVAEGGDALILQAEAHAAAGNLAAARAAYKQAIPLVMQADAAPAKVRALGGLSWVLNALGEPGAALLCAEEALRVQAAADTSAFAPMVIIHGFTGNALMALGRFGDALGQYSMALNLQRRLDAPPADRAATLNLLGEAAGRFGRFDLAEKYQAEALTHLRAALPARDPQLAIALANLGVSLFRNDNASDAEAALREALDIDPALLLASENLIHVLYKQDRKDEGRALAEQKYRQRSFVVQRPPPRSLGTLLLLWSLDGTVPHHHLLAGLPMTLIDWHIEYADAAQENLLPPPDLVLNLIGDADQGARALDAAIDFQSRCTVPLLNDPRKIRRTNRDLIAAHLAGIDGVVIPHVTQFTGAALQCAHPSSFLAEQGFSVPVLLRDAGMHGGESVRLFTTTTELDQACRDLPPGNDVYVTTFYDYASPDGLFRKYRAIFIDRKPYPYHLAISPRWLVHYFSADMLEHSWKLAEEMRYLDDMAACLGPRAMAALEAIGRRMDLDYCGIDFSLLPDGRLLLFECNATMLVHPEQADGPLAAKNGAVRRIIEDFQQLVLARAGAAQGEVEGS